MCGRFSQAATSQHYLKHLGIEYISEIDSSPSWNVAPSQKATIIYCVSDAVNTELMYWGLSPSWAKEDSIKPINARIETASRKPFFRSAWKHRHCLIPVDAYYEWQILPNGTKQPYRFYSAVNDIFYLAGLFEIDKNNEKNFSILTTEADNQLKTFHDRKPVALLPSHAMQWIKDQLSDDQALSFCSKHQLQSSQIKHYPISTRINRPSENDENLINRL